MREIKFRAWNKHKALMIYDVDINSYGQVIKYDYGQYDGSYDYPVMQYTGLKDKNGLEIYEGDIFRDNDTFLWEVIFEDGAYVVKGGEYDMTEALIEFTPEHCEVIGNIYENPGLMDDADN